MKAILVIFVAALFAGSDARWLRGIERDGFMKFDQKPLKYNENMAYSSRIINGQPADIADFPHMLALLDLTAGGFICGASIISSNWVLSAAHCLEFRVAPSNINFRAGSTSRNSGGTVYIAASYSLHPQYNTRTLENDVALARTTQTMGGTNISPVALPPSCSTACCSVCDGVMVTTTGWGRNENNQFPINLVQLTKPVHNFDDCVRIWAGFRTTITADMFCKSAFNNQDTCDGDSGSPLVTGTGTGRVQVGVVSFGSPTCADNSRPSGNARVEFPAIRSWITSTAGI